MKLFPEATDPQKIQAILTAPCFQKALDKMERRCQRFRENPVEALPFHLYRKFYIDGDRRSWEDIYFTRRGRLSYLTLAILLHHRKEDIEALEDAIWAICEEFTWVLPAHTSDLGDRYNTEVIDLFSAETGFALSEIVYLLGDTLDPKITCRIRECLEERIFRMYLENSYTWETVSMNWASVCAGCIGGAFIYCAPERFHLVKDRILATMKTFLLGFGEDGICLEGIHYWGYGFGFFTYFAQLLYEFTDGKENLFADPICQKTAFFQEYAFLRKNHTISFSDGERNCEFLPGLTHKLHSLYGSRLLPMEYAAFSEYCHRFPAYLRNFFWVDPQAAVPAAAENTAMYFPSSQWFVASNERLSLAAKSGHNDEPHNHNDIGSFLLTCDNGQILCDFGAGEYTGDYFRKATRYNYLCNNSFGHSVPIINGQGQKVGAEHCGKVLSADGGSFCLDIAGAYDQAQLHSLIRQVQLTDKGFRLQDRFAGTDLTVTERFVTMIPPCQTENGVILNGFCLQTVPHITPHISQETIINHEGHPDTLYLIDYAVSDAREFVLTVQ